MSVSLTSALTPEFNPLTNQNSVVYTTTSDGTELSLDVWPATRNDDDLLSCTSTVVRGPRFQVFDIDYRLAPNESWTDEVGDVKCALGWIVDNADPYDVDTSRISILGNSAGGNPAMVAAYSAGDRALPPSCDVPAVEITSVVNIYGPPHMADLYENGGSPGTVQPAMRDYVGGTPEEFPDRYSIEGSAFSHRRGG